MIVHDAHQSGHVTATHKQVELMLHRVTSHATVGGLTEASAVTMPDGWQSAGHESRVVWDTSRWEHVASPIASIRTPAWHRGRDLRHSVDVAAAVLENKRHGVRLYRFEAHPPAHLDDDSQRAANDAFLDRIADVIAGHVDHWHPDVIIGSADFNRTLNAQADRKRVRRAFAPVGLHLHLPPKHTLGGRIIDAYVTDAHRPTVGMLTRLPGFDHRGITLTAGVDPAAER